MKKKLLLFSAFLALFSTAFAQEKNFSVDAQVRNRGEYRNGALAPRAKDEKASAFINHRARLGMTYLTEGLTLRVAAQHVGVWGEDPQIERNGRVMMNEAWAKINFTPQCFAQVGRQALAYDDQRILGGLDWQVAGRFHDALRLGYENEMTKIHLIAAFNQNKELVKGGTYYEPTGQPYKAMQTVWLNSSLSKQFNVSLLFMNLGLQAGKVNANPHTNQMQTFGTYLTFKPAKLTLNASAYYQTGKNKADKAVSAYMLGVKGTYKACNKLSIVALTDYLSGDPKSEKHTAFDPLYGTHHIFYGTMDYFYVAPYKNGLWDKQLSLILNAAASTTLSFTYHHFSSTYDITDVNGKVGRALGSEVDLELKHTIMKNVTLQGGFSMMFGSSYMDVIKGGDAKVPQSWGWLSLNINPKIFTTKW